MLKFVTVFKSKSNSVSDVLVVPKSYISLQFQFYYMINYTKLSVWLNLCKSLRKIFKLTLSSLSFLLSKDEQPQ